MIPTITQDLSLFEVNRNREYYKMCADRRKVVRLTSLIFLCVAVALYILIIYG